MNTTETTALAPDASPESPRRRPWVAWSLLAVAVAAVALPVVLVGTAALGDVWRPSGDWAVLALRVSDVGNGSPLVGPYSRYGWNHPGPMLYWALAGPYHLLGREPVDLLFGTALLNALAFAGTLGLAWRRGRLPLVLLTGATLALLSQGLGPEVLRDPWNPYITLAPVALFAFLMWSVADGERWPVPIAAVVGSFLVQSHVGYAVLVIAMVTTTVAIVVLARRGANPEPPSDRLRHRRRRTGLVLATAVALGVCWGPVLVDQVAGSGNLTAMVEYFAGGDETTVGVPDAVGLAARNLTVPDAPWLGGDEPTVPDGGGLAPASATGLLPPVVAFGLALEAARRAGAGSAVRFQILVGVSVLAGIVATSRITGEPYSYLLRWWWVVAALFWLSIAWSAGNAAARWIALPRTANRAVTWSATALAVALLVNTGATTARAGSSADVPDGSLTAILGELVEPTVGALAGRGPLLVRATGSVWGTAGDGIRLELERAGIPVVADPDDAYRLGPQRSAEERPAAHTLWVVSADAATAWQARPEMELVAAWDPVDPLTRARYLVAVDSLQRQLIAAGEFDLAVNLAMGGDTRLAPEVPGVDVELLAQVEEIRRKGDPIALFLGPPV
ncbi:MAG: hypothetical protein MUE36_15640 [Acidimicrobiales bacterium]|nr:hypothetical protein [Acidimicrobiales bacterium]